MRTYQYIVKDTVKVTKADYAYYFKDICMIMTEFKFPSGISIIIGVPNDDQGRIVRQ